MLLGIRTDCMASDTSHAALGKPDNVLRCLQGLSVSGPEGLVSPQHFGMIGPQRSADLIFSSWFVGIPKCPICALMFSMTGKFPSIYMYLFIFIFGVCMHIHAHMSVVFTKARRGCWIPLALESQVAVSHLLGVLGTELRSSERAVFDLNCLAISPTPSPFISHQLHVRLASVYVSVNLREC